MIREMASNISWLGHDGFLIKAGGRNIVIDPFKLESAVKADILLISHDHFDHCSVDDAAKVLKPRYSHHHRKGFGCQAVRRRSGGRPRRFRGNRGRGCHGGSRLQHQQGFSSQGQRLAGFLSLLIMTSASIMQATRTSSRKWKRWTWTSLCCPSPAPML